MPEDLPAPEGSPRTGARAGERRRWPRRACRPPPAMCYVLWPGPLGGLGRAVDIGPGGIGFLAERPLRPWSVLALQVLSGAPAASRMRVARVAHCIREDDGRWRLGCEVEPPFSPEEVASLH